MVRRPLRNSTNIFKKFKRRGGRESPIKYKGKPIHIDDINNLMSIFPWYYGLHLDKVIADTPKLDKVIKYIVKRVSKEGLLGMIILYDAHFRSLIIDCVNDMSVEYYDAFGVPPEFELQEMIFKIISLLRPTCLLKYKVNMVQNQNKKTNNCGLHSINFLLDRLENGDTFSEATKFSIMDAEKRARILGGELKKFDYI